MKENETIFVISDIHINITNKNRINGKLEKLKNYIDYYTSLNERKNSILLISGDIASKGIKQEYSMIKDSLSELSKVVNILVCPGNHDHDFSNYSDSMRNVLLNNIEDIEIEKKLFDQVSSGMSYFFDFKKSIEMIKPTKTSLIASSYSISEKLCIQSLNSSWCSNIKEKPGTLFTPLDEILPPEEGKTNIIFFHHPISWLKIENSKAVRNYLNSNFQIVISGHEHLHNNFKVETDSNSSLFIESLSFDSSNTADDGFFIIEKSESESESEIKVKRYIEENDEYKLRDEFTKDNIIQNKGITKNGIELSEKFSAKLKSLEVGFSHSEKKEVKLDDVFVFPNLGERHKGKHSLNRINSEEIIKSSVEYEKIIIMGEESSGKTSLLKTYFCRLFDLGMLPVLISGRKLKKIKKISSSFLEQQIEEQYKNIKSVDFFNNSKEKKILLFDDFESIKSNKTEINQKLHFLENIFGRIIITVSDSYDLSEGLLNKIPTFRNFEWVHLLNMGHKLRYQLVNRWNKLSEENRISQEKLIYRNDAAVKTIDSVLGNNYIPSTPFFLLTVLQSMESGNTSELKTSSYGYYYQYLITSSLGMANVDKTELDAFFNYIKELAFFFYEEDTKTISEFDLHDFHRNFCEEYGLTINQESRKKKLLSAKILMEEDQLYSFKYPYIYYFFIANYLADNLEQDGIKNKVKQLIQNLDNGKNSNILMFLTHHTKDKGLLDSIVARSKLLFQNFNPANLDVGAQFVDDIVGELPEITFCASESDSHKNRLKYQEARDNVEIQDSDGEFKPNMDEYSSQEEREEIVDLIQQIGMSIKSLELLGQLSKNYYGSLKLERKKSLLKEAIEGPLRAVESIFDTFRNNPNEIIQILEDKISNQDIEQRKEKHKLQELAKDTLFMFLVTISYGIVKKIASSIADLNLINVIDELQKEKNTNSFKLVYLAVCLDTGRSDSPAIVQKTMKSINENAISSLMIKAFVRNYLYMFEVREREAQSLCNRVGISYTGSSKPIRLKRLKSPVKSEVS